ncbi:MAG: hypothetical protein FWD57_09565, partial [Polyangiaceae bacterium]|nr:hypothetical protein [Polyangiaceae bacterium]
MPELVRAKSISAGSEHTCVVTATSAQVVCWGANYCGQLGNESEEHGLTYKVSGLEPGVLSVTAMSLRSCAVTSAGAVACWGDNTYGQLGDGTTISRNAATLIGGLPSDVVGIINKNGAPLINGLPPDMAGITGRNTAPLVGGLPSGVVRIAGGN